MTLTQLTFERYAIDTAGNPVTETAVWVPADPGDPRSVTTKQLARAVGQAAFDAQLAAGGANTTTVGANGWIRLAVSAPLADLNPADPSSWLHYTLPVRAGLAVTDRAGRDKATAARQAARDDAEATRTAARQAADAKTAQTRQAAQAKAAALKASITSMLPKIQAGKPLTSPERDALGALLNAAADQIANAA